MTKEEAVAYLLSIDFDNGNTAVRAALEAEQGKRTETPKAAKAPKAAKPKKSTPSLDAIAARAKATKTPPKSTVSKAQVEAQLAGMEDAPY
jgi:hypothetical protein